MLARRLVLAWLLLSIPDVVDAQLVPATALRNIAPPAQRWVRGNTHTHTWNSDGDSSPDEVLHWYREHGYQFVVITDHEWVTDVAPLNAMLATANRFLAISGQEITQRVADTTHPAGAREAHVNAIGTRQVILPIGEAGMATGTRVSATLRRNAGLIRDAGGVPQANHPNFRWSVYAAELMGMPDSALLEVYNGHLLSNNEGGTSIDGVYKNPAEAIWDTVLTRGKLLFGVASDDVHSIDPADAEKPEFARPGRGWIHVRAETLSTPAILAALHRGEFYASTGVTLRAYEASQSQIRVWIQLQDDRRYRTEFVGRGGRILATSNTLHSTYQIVGDEGYVRARVVDSAGKKAWMQPVVVRGPR